MLCIQLLHPRKPARSAPSYSLEQAGKLGEDGGGAPPQQLTLKVDVAKAALLLSLLSREDDAAPLGSARGGPGMQAPPHRVLERTPLLEAAAAALTGACVRGSPRRPLAALPPIACQR